MFKPRPEHPRPHLRRPDWLSLNGTWEFEIDTADSGLERGLLDRPLAQTITVPFAPESVLSGVGNTDFLEAVWYRRVVETPGEWPDGRVLLHFQAVDYDATVWIDGHEVGRHRGGFTPFTFDITDHLRPGHPFTLTVRARDPHTGAQARGKQATWYANSEVFYTRTTGIWQTVWLEHVPDSYIRRPKITPDVAGRRFLLTVPIAHTQPGQRVRATVTSETGSAIAGDEVACANNLASQLVLQFAPDQVRLWHPEDPYLYSITLELVDGGGRLIDKIVTEAGLRSVAVAGKEILLNGQPLFQQLVLDQGYWPDGLMTAPTEQHIVDDIRLALDAGFNGARLHQKVFEESYLYHADRMGFLVWAEFADWGCSGLGPSGDNQRPEANYIGQWLEVLERDYSHPSIIGWCPMNETYQVLHDRVTVLDDVTRAMFLATKAADPTRPVIDASGYSHRVVETDVFDSHLYEQDPAVFAELLAGLSAGAPYVNRDHQGRTVSVPYAGQPYMVSEYGGIWWAAEGTGADHESSWGYGDRVADAEAFYQRFEALTAVLTTNPDMFGYCYTQLCDVFQEHNGLYNFDRTHKLDIDRIRSIQERLVSRRIAADGPNDRQATA